MTATAIVLPQLMAAKLTTRMQERFGLTMAVDGRAALSLENGLGVELRGVTLTDREAQGVPLASIGRMIVAAPLAQFFGGDDIRKVKLVEPVFTFSADAPQVSEAGDVAVAAPTAKPTAKPLDLTIENGTLKASDDAHGLVIAVSDISGQVTQAEDGTLQARLRGLLNAVPTELTLAVDDVRRLREKGSPADVSIISKNGQIILSGRLGLAHDVGFDGSVSAESENAHGFLAWLGLPLKGLAQSAVLGLDAGLSIAKSRAAFKGLAFSLGEMQAKGAVDVQASGERPSVNADLAFNLLDLNIYHRDPRRAAPDLSTDWTEKALPFDDLKAVDGTVNLTADAFKAGVVEAGASFLKATLADGALVARVESAALFGGKGVLDLSLAHGKPTQVKIGLDVAGVAAQSFLDKAFGVSFLSGPADLTLDLTTAGESPAQLISTLAGSASLQLRNGSINGIDLAARVGLLKTGDAEGWGLSAEEATVVTSATAAATFADGIAVLKDTRIGAAGVDADITGQVDLLRRAVDLKVAPGEGLPLPVAASVTGPWDKPKLSAGIATENGLPDETEKVAKEVVKKAKKKLKKLLRN